MNLRKLFALLMTAVMLLGMVPAGYAEGGNMMPGGEFTVSCNHNWAWRFPNGEPKHCQEERLMEMFCTLCGQVASSYPVTGDHTPGSWQWDGTPPANCYEWGIQNQFCSVCGEVFNEREVQGEHQWSAYVTETPAGCETPGEEVSYCTVCGERGNHLSGGQRQRTSLARALVRAPQILLLDDTLSAVDTATEARILNALKTEFEGRTVIVIAHRLSAVLGADEILYMDHGKVIERGTHDELLALDGEYAHIFHQQQKGDEEEEVAQA